MSQKISTWEAQATLQVSLEIANLIDMLKQMAPQHNWESKMSFSTPDAKIPTLPRVDQKASIAKAYGTYRNAGFCRSPIF